MDENFETIAEAFSRTAEKYDAFAEDRTWRRVQTRTASGDRETLVETDEMPGVDSRWSPFQEITTEITRSGSKIQTRRDVTGFAYQSQRQ